jgi:hypothetical protein
MREQNQFVLGFDEVVESLPPPVRLDKANDQPSQASCFVGILGFEPRCHAAATRLAQAGFRAGRAFCVRYDQPEMRRANEKYQGVMLQALQALSDEREPVPLKHDDRNLDADFGTVLLGRISEEGLDPTSPHTHVVFDITVGSSRLLLEGLHALLSSGVTLTLAYSEAADYRPSFEEFRKFDDDSRQARVPAPEFLTMGVEKVEILRRIPGHSADARPTYLAAFPSFSPTRIGAVLEELSPSRVHWLFGVPHLVRNRWRIDAQRKYHEALFEHQHRHCYVSTFDYRETLSVLESIYQKRKNDYAMLVCSLGSKLQKVGQVLFHTLRPEVGALVSIPRIWDPDRFSSETPHAVHMVPLGACGTLRNRLWMTRTLRL